jgi:septal ring-binding cell division protein DamX
MQPAQVPPARRLRRWAWLSGALVAALGLLAFVAWRALPLTAAPSAQSVRPPLPPAAAPAVDMAERARQTAHWLATAAPGTHVIQMASAKEAGEAAVLLGSLNAATPQPVRVLHGLSRGKPAWMILAGEFPNREAAMAALRTLPTSAPDDPFLRTVGKMRAVVLPTGS